GDPAPVTGRSPRDVPATMPPTFPSEMVWTLVIVCLLVYIDRARRLGGGRLFMPYEAGYALGRFFIAMLRTDPATTVFGDIRINVVVSAVAFVTAAILFWATRNRRRENPEYVRGNAERSTEAE